MKKNGMQKSGEKPSIMVSHRFFHLGAFGKMGHFPKGQVYCLPLIDASINPLNKGCGRVGREVNSGWNWEATNHG